MEIYRKPLLPQNFKPYDLVGITADTTRYQEALKVATLAKTAEKLVARGGYHVSFLDNKALETGFIDFVIRGKGEDIFSNLLQTLENNGDLSGVDGISYQNDGPLVRNKDAPPPKDLDAIPFQPVIC